MTSDEIKAIRDGLPSGVMNRMPQTEPLWEIAYQLAVMNERNASGDQQAVDAMLKKVGLGLTVGVTPGLKCAGHLTSGPRARNLSATADAKRKES